MCGIAGLLGPPPSGTDTRAVVAAMAESLAHRGPDGSGVWNDPQAAVALGHRRLAVIDPSPAGAQPMVSASGRTVVVFNGCVYNFGELRSRLGPSIDWRGHSDTEVLVEAIDAWGPSIAAERAEGMFAFASWDRRDRRLSLVRDRLGEKPLYWGIVGGQLAFASDVAALRAIPAFDGQVDPAAVASLLRWSFIAHPLTIYRGIEQLAPGTIAAAQWDGTRIVVRRSEYWSIATVAAAAASGRAASRPIPMSEAADRVEQLVAASVATRLVADVPTGAFLSGGIDSSLVAALAQRHLGGEPLRTFTVAMPEIGFDESAAAAAVASHLGTAHSTLELSTAEALEIVPRLSTMYSEPFADPSMLPSAVLCAAVRGEVTVALSGDGGDEAFAGYNRHVFGPRAARNAERLPRWARRPLAHALHAVPPRFVDAVVRTTGRAIPSVGAQRNVGDKVHKLAGVLGATDSASTWEKLAETWPQRVVGERFAASPVAGLTGPADPLDALLLADTQVVLPDEMLVKLDRASMAVGLEVRTPLLDYRLVEYAWSLDRSTLVDGRIGKAVLRRVLGGHVPATLTDRPKMGFDPPLGSWLRGPLRPWAESLLGEQRLRDDGWIDAAAVRSTWRRHLAGEVNAEYRLWAVLMLNSWLDANAGR